jgi:allophanate hydrolase subunit 2
MGYRLKGPAIAHARGHDIVSDGIPLGGIQVPGEGQPIVLLVDRQTAGGYTKIATVIGVDIGAIGQTRPGQRVRFRQVTLEEAHAALAAEAAWLARAAGPAVAGTVARTAAGTAAGTTAGTAASTSEG